MLSDALATATIETEVGVWALEGEHEPRLALEDGIVIVASGEHRVAELFALPDAPVTRVSWFAASAYCQSRGKDLPTVEQWERAAAGGGKDPAATRDRILEWYGRPASDSLAEVGRGAPNAYGVHDMHGLIWEWTLDFNSAMVSTESRDPGARDDPLFCGSGSLGAADPSDYATFMRYAMRNSLRASYTTGTLGFRCAREPDRP